MKIKSEHQQNMMRPLNLPKILSGATVIILIIERWKAQQIMHSKQCLWHKDCSECLKCTNFVHIRVPISCWVYRFLRNGKWFKTSGTYASVWRRGILDHAITILGVPNIVKGPKFRLVDRGEPKQCEYHVSRILRSAEVRNKVENEMRAIKPEQKKDWHFSSSISFKMQLLGMIKILKIDNRLRLMVFGMSK